ncbi:hypothetical protein C7B80_00090 [Cyanosarcina cf. burmensis CCALA 770]|nr:hypothetical protein C7B80_00090 [Cyanosarcina cf. burmensis CCALA 770]
MSKQAIETEFIENKAIPDRPFFFVFSCYTTNKKLQANLMKLGQMNTASEVVFANFQVFY